MCLYACCIPNQNMKAIMSHDPILKCYVTSYHAGDRLKTTSLTVGCAEQHCWSLKILKSMLSKIPGICVGLKIRYIFSWHVQFRYPCWKRVLANMHTDAILFVAAAASSFCAQSLFTNKYQVGDVYGPRLPHLDLLISSPKTNERLKRHPSWDEPKPQSSLVHFEG